MWGNDGDGILSVKLRALLEAYRDLETSGARFYMWNDISGLLDKTCSVVEFFVKRGLGKSRSEKSSATARPRHTEFDNAVLHTTGHLRD